MVKILFDIVYEMKRQFNELVIMTPVSSHGLGRLNCFKRNLVINFLSERSRDELCNFTAFSAYLT